MKEKNYRAELTGVFGDSVDGNPTGVMEEAAYEAKGLNYRYITMKVTKEDFEAAFNSVKAINMKGVNLTMPHKITVLDYLDELSPAAKIIGAVNTVVVREDGSLFGENTDGKGFVQALVNKGITVEDKDVAILGAGGAARAIAVECALSGASKVTIINRTLSKAEELAGVVASNTPAKAEAMQWEANMTIPAGTEILVQATNIGLHPDVDQVPDINFASVEAGSVAVDVVFNPAETGFLKKCEEQGAVSVNGLGMLACQGGLNFTLWTGVEAPLDVMEAKLREEFNL